MTQNQYTTQIFDKEHHHFGGVIYPSDFNTDYRGKDNTYGSDIAKRIEADFRRERRLYEGTQKWRKYTWNSKTTQ